LIHIVLIKATRKAMQETGKPYIIENVAGARFELDNPIMLCGTMFGLRVIRHRYFECSPRMISPPFLCNHIYKTGKRGEYDKGQNGYITVAGHNFNREFARAAMGIDWMTRDELSQAIPPAYTKWIGEQILAQLDKS
jgi:DNA (cytosine-5)-methyltransferase 1